jgi:hypothetical protein
VLGAVGRWGVGRRRAWQVHDSLSDKNPFVFGDSADSESRKIYHAFIASLQDARALSAVPARV